jgi:hypothetical protein
LYPSPPGWGLEHWASNPFSIKNSTNATETAIERDIHYIVTIDIPKKVQNHKHLLEAVGSHVGSEFMKRIDSNLAQ